MNYHLSNSSPWQHRASESSKPTDLCLLKSPPCTNTTYGWPSLRNENAPSFVRLKYHKSPSAEVDIPVAVTLYAVEDHQSLYPQAVTAGVYAHASTDYLNSALV